LTHILQRDNIKPTTFVGFFMLTVSKKSQYGLRAMVLLAKNYENGKVLSTKLISEQEGIPFDFLEKIVSKLEKAKLIKGKKGVQGGYILSKKPNQISAKDIVFVLEENKKPVDCSLCGKQGACLSKNVWAQVEYSLSKTLESITLGKLIS
jgi:Rrf2 family protein